MAYIYKITNILNNKCYIGKTLGTIENRFKQHCKDYKRQSKEQRPLYSAMKKYGIENFKIEKIEQCLDKDADEREKYWIEYYGSFKNGYNATIGGDGKAYIDRQLVIQVYKKTKNCKETARLCNISISSVYNILKSNNIKLNLIKQIIRGKCNKPIIMLNLQGERLKIFSTIKEAVYFLKPNEKNQNTINGAISHIHDVANGKRKTAYKYKWQWL